MTDAASSEPHAEPRRSLTERVRALDRSIVVSVLVVTYVFGAALTWAMLAPMGAAPDEPGHVAYAAAVVRGDLGTPVPGGDEATRRIVTVTAPQWVNTFTSPPRTVENFNYPCFATVVFRAADCAPDLSGSTTLSEVPTTVGRYPPLFHAVVGLPTLVLSGSRAVYAMRIVAAALSAAVIGLGLAVASPARRTWLALATALVFTPTAAHLAGSVNPSGPEISAAIGLGAGLMGLTGPDARRRWAVPSLLILAVVLAWTRPLGYLMLVGVVVASLLINRDELRAWSAEGRRRLQLTLGAGAVVASAIAFRILWGLPVRAASAANPTTGSTLFSSIGLGSSIDRVEQHLIDWSFDFVGRFGWVDHAAPGSVLLAWTLVVLVLAFFVLLGTSRRDRITLTVVGVGALVAAPALAIAMFINDTAYEARYHLPLAVLVVIGFATVTTRMARSDERRIARATLRWGAVLAPPIMLIATVASLHRYAFGVEAQLVDLRNLVGGGAAWLPPREALAGAGVGGAIVTLSAVSLFLATRSRPSPEPAEFHSASHDGQ